MTALRTLSDNSDRFAEAGDCSDDRAPVDRGYYAIFAVDPDGYRIRSLLWSLGGLRSGLPLICYGAREGRKVCRLAAGGGWIRTIRFRESRHRCPHVDFSVEAAEPVDLVGDWPLTFAAAGCDLVRLPKLIGAT